MTEWFYHITCFAKVLKSCNKKAIIAFRFIIKKSAHIKWDVIVPSSLRLLFKLRVWYRCQNIKFYHHDAEKLAFNKKSTHQNTEQEAYYKKRKILIYCIWQKLHSRERQMPCSAWR